MFFSGIYFHHFTCLTISICLGWEVQISEKSNTRIILQKKMQNLFNLNSGFASNNFSVPFSCCPWAPNLLEVKTVKEFDFYFE